MRGIKSDFRTPHTPPGQPGAGRDDGPGILIHPMGPGRWGSGGQDPTPGTLATEAAAGV